MRVIAFDQVAISIALKMVAPIMKNQGGGSIINISSVSGFNSSIGGVAYTSAKYALRRLTQTAALEFGPHGIRVNSVHPGIIETSMVDHPELRPQLDEFATTLPMRRFGDPGEATSQVFSDWRFKRKGPYFSASEKLGWAATTTEVQVCRSRRPAQIRFHHAAAPQRAMTNRPEQGTAESRRLAHATNSTARGRKSRAVLIDAAREVFERDGYFDARVEDIVATAGVARGSFYTYFENKSDVLEEIAATTLDQLSEASVASTELLLADPIGLVEQLITRYFEVYRKNARMMEVITQVAVVDPVHQRHRLEGRRRMVSSVSSAIRVWQQHGIAADVDPDLTAAALCSMITNFAYWRFVADDPEHARAADDALVAVWARAIGLTMP